MIPDEGVKERREDDTWHLIRGIPIAVLLAITVQTITAVWYMAGLVSRVDSQAVELARVAAKLDALASAVQATAVPLALYQARIELLDRELSQTRERLGAMERAEKAAQR